MAAGAVLTANIGHSVSALLVKQSGRCCRGTAYDACRFKQAQYNKAALPPRRYSCERAKRKRSKLVADACQHSRKAKLRGSRTRTRKAQVLGLATPISYEVATEVDPPRLLRTREPYREEPVESGCSPSDECDGPTKPELHHCEYNEEHRSSCDGTQELRWNSRRQKPILRAIKVSAALKFRFLSKPIPRSAWQT
ncbi:hypothetical protein MTO96_044923 [Rhipicephalus appendiculatus]